MNLGIFLAILALLLGINFLLVSCNSIDEELKEAHDYANYMKSDYKERETMMSDMLPKFKQMKTDFLKSLKGCDKFYKIWIHDMEFIAKLYEFDEYSDNHDEEELLKNFKVEKKLLHDQISNEIVKLERHIKEFGENKIYLLNLKPQVEKEMIEENTAFSGLINEVETSIGFLPRKNEKDKQKIKEYEVEINKLADLERQLHIIYEGISDNFLKVVKEMDKISEKLKMYEVRLKKSKEIRNLLKSFEDFPDLKKIMKLVNELKLEFEFEDKPPTSKDEL